MNINNISLQNEDISLRTSTTYIIIDALLINDINLEISNLSEYNLDELKTCVFPYTYGPFMKYTPTKENFQINKIKKVHYAENKLIDPEGINAFSTDTAFLIFINERIFYDFIPKFNYDNIFTDNPTEIEIDMVYWNEITKNYNYRDTAIVIANYEYGVEFDGSGLYTIDN
jgi:hypothetical protein